MAKLSKVEIEKKVKELEEETLFIERCLKVNVCPECGGNLTKHVYQHRGMPPLEWYVCEGCGVRYG